MGVSNVTASVDVNGTTGRSRARYGAILVTGNGVAGSLEGNLKLRWWKFCWRNDISFRFNNTGSVVDTTLLVGDELNWVIFGSAENVFDVLLGGFTLNIGGVVTIEGDVTFTSQEWL